MRRVNAVVVWLVVAVSAQGQSVSMPSEVTAPVGRLSTLAVKFEGKVLRWVSLDNDLGVIREYDETPGQVTLRLIPFKEGTYKIVAYTAKGDVPSEPAVCVVKTGGEPGPNPPGPNPPPSPPVPSGLRVLVVYESAELSKLPATQTAALYSAAVRDYLQTHCVMDAAAGNRAWRIWDKDADVTNVSPEWKAMMAAKRESLPWIVIQGEKSSYSGPFPQTAVDVLALLQKYGGK